MSAITKVETDKLCAWCDNRATLQLNTKRPEWACGDHKGHLSAYLFNRALEDFAMGI